jgi:nitrous oxidase accessory protein NosD
MTLDEIKNPSVRIQDPFVAQGGVYGVAWRIGTGTFGSEIATGWVENSTFEHNYIGAFTFGASGMMWLKNLFTDNHVYGLDPHDDSNNATIEYNRFVANGKHGFIMSKRCDYNTIEYNVSIDNAFHGFMLHDNSDYNIIEHNVSIGNYDNFAVYASSYNEITDNNGYNPRGSQVRINEGSLQNYVENNNFYGGHRGVYLYSTANGVDIENNNFYLVGIPLATKGTTRVLYAGNNSNVLDYQIGKGDRVVFGVNYIHQRPYISLAPLQILSTGKLTGQPLTTSAMDILLLDNKNA